MPQWSTSVVLRCGFAIGMVQVITEAPLGTKSIVVQPAWEECRAFISTQEVVPDTNIHFATLPETEGLTQQQVSQANALFAKYNSIFSKDDGVPP